LATALALTVIACCVAQAATIDASASASKTFMNRMTPPDPIAYSGLYPHLFGASTRPEVNAR